MKTYQKLPLSLLTICISQQLYAETNDLQENQTPTATLDTIVITAGKIERTSQDTVDSVTATTTDQIENNPTLTNIKDVLRNTANVSSENRYDFSIRGISNYGPTNGGTAEVYNVLVDGVTQQPYGMFDGTLSTWDMKQVEILRGAQSTTAGQNALAGSVVLNSEDPEFEQGGKVQTSYGTDNTYQLALANTGAITDNLAYRISAENKHTDGHAYNSFFKRDDWDTRDTLTVRGKLLYFINDDSDLKLTVSHVNQDTEGSENSLSKSEIINDNNEASKSETTNDNYALEYNNQLTPDWSIKTTTAYIDSKYSQDNDLDAGDGLSRWQSEKNAKQVSQEVLFNYDDDDKLQAVVGLYGAKGETNNPGNTKDLAIDLPTQTPLGVVPATVNSTFDGNDDFDNYAIFVNADYHLTPKLTILSGIRYDYDKRVSDTRQTFELSKPTGYGNQADQTIQGLLSSSVGPSDGERVNKVWLPKIGLDYAWTDNFKTGIVYKKGYRPGGVSLNIISRQAKEFDPEYTDNYELSARFQDDDNKLSIKGNLFYTDWQDQQVTINGDSGIEYDTYVVNAGKSHLYGAELEGAYQATPEVELTAGIGLVHTEFDNYKNDGVDYQGKEFSNARQVTANAGMTYHDKDGWFVGSYLNYHGKGWQDVENNIALDPYTLLNVKAGYKTDHWGAYAYVNNFLDTDYITSKDESNPNKPVYMLGDPRTLGVTVNYEW